MKKELLYSGQSLLEVIFALVLVGLVVIAIVGLSTISIRNNIYSRNKTLAKRYAQEAIEWVRKKRDVGPWAYFYSFSGDGSASTYCLSGLNSEFGNSWTLGPSGSCASDEFISGTTFIRELKLTKKVGQDDTVIAEVVITWNDGQGDHKSQITTEFTKW